MQLTGQLGANTQVRSAYPLDASQGGEHGVLGQKHACRTSGFDYRRCVGDMAELERRMQVDGIKYLRVTKGLSRPKAVCLTYK